MPYYQHSVGIQGKIDDGFNVLSRNLSKRKNYKNTVESFKVTMVLMMIVLTTFVGAIIMSMQLQEAAAKLESSYCKRLIFGGGSLGINMQMLLIISLITFTGASLE